VICYVCRAANDWNVTAWHHWCKARRLNDERSTWCDCQHVGETSADGVVAPPYQTMLLDIQLDDVPEPEVEKYEVMKSL